MSSNSNYVDRNYKPQSLWLVFWQPKWFSMENLLVLYTYPWFSIKENVQ